VRATRGEAERRFYNDRRWRRARLEFLAQHPLCRYCEADGRITPAAIVDHVVPIAKAPDLAWNPANWQPLCKTHHDSMKQGQERRGYHGTVDAQGYPIDPAHPANRGGIASKSLAPVDRRRHLAQSKPAGPGDA